MNRNQPLSIKLIVYFLTFFFGMHSLSYGSVDLSGVSQSSKSHLVSKITEQKVIASYQVGLPSNPNEDLSKTPRFSKRLTENTFTFAGYIFLWEGLFDGYLKRKMIEWFLPDTPMEWLKLSVIVLGGIFVIRMILYVTNPANLFKLFKNNTSGENPKKRKSPIVTVLGFIIFSVVVLFIMNGIKTTSTERIYDEEGNLINEKGDPDFSLWERTESFSTENVEPINTTPALPDNPKLRPHRDLMKWLFDHDLVIAKVHPRLIFEAEGDVNTEGSASLYYGYGRRVATQQELQAILLINRLIAQGQGYSDWSLENKDNFSDIYWIVPYKADEEDPNHYQTLIPNKNDFFYAEYLWEDFFESLQLGKKGRIVLTEKGFEIIGISEGKRQQIDQMSLFRFPQLRAIFSRPKPDDSFHILRAA